jgi:tetratricopeptide (TPR) repeat protein
MLGKTQVDVLVSPFQVDGDTLDVVARNLMARSLASAIRRRLGKTVADCGLVEQALGSAGRIYSEDSVVALAGEVGAKAAIVGFVGHDGNGRYRLRVEALRLTGGKVASRESLGDFANIAFGDTNLPYASFLQRRDEILAAFEPTARPPAAAGPSAAAADRLPRSVSELEEQGSLSAIRSSQLLQFLGVLHPAGVYSRSQERLFERSLVVLDGAPETSGTRLLRARAFVYLHRRPAAVAALGAPRTPTQRALAAYLDGNLNTLSALLPKIDDPVAKLEATVERERLRMDYGRAADQQLAKTLAEEYPYWAPLAIQALNENDSWGDHTDLMVNAALDTYFPSRKYSLETLARGAQALGKEISLDDLTELAYRHIASLEKDAYAGWLAARQSSDGPFQGDVLDLLREMLVADTVAEAAHIGGALGKPDNALAYISKREVLFPDQPELTIERGWAEFDLSSDRPEPEKSNLQASAYEHLRAGSIWLQGQTRSTARVLPFSHQFFPGSDALPDAQRARMFYDSDWPNRPGWGWRSSDDEADRIRRLTHCVAYTITDLHCLDELSATLRVDGQGGAAAELLRELEHRFNGHPQRVQVLAGARQDADDPEGADSVFTDAISSGSTDWEPYRRIGTALAKSDKPDEALKVFLKYPGFARPGIANNVALSNDAYNAGTLLYAAGAYEQARPLYEIAANLHTGSYSSIVSASRLALMQGDLETAAGATAAAVRRYGSTHALTTLMMLANALGEQDTGWAIFETVEGRLEKPGLWLGPFAMHEAEGASLETVTDWAFEPARAKASTRFESLSMRYVFLYATTDREATEALSQTLRAHNPDPPVTLDGDGFVTRNGRMTLAPSLSLFGDPLPKRTSQPPTRPSKTVEARLTTASMALVALAKKDYAAAFELLDDATRVYQMREFLPYYAWVAAQVGSTERIGRYLENSERRTRASLKHAVSSMGPFFDDYLAEAMLQGAKGQHEEAIEYLTKTKADMLPDGDRAVLPRYEILDLAEILYEHTHFVGYRDFLLNLARQYAVTNSLHAYPHAFVARYTPDAAERARELARALYLDPNSKRAGLAKPADIAAAKKANERTNPFGPPPPDASL